MAASLLLFSDLLSNFRCLPKSLAGRMPLRIDAVRPGIAGAGEASCAALGIGLFLGRLVGCV